MSDFNTILAAALAEMNKVTNADRIRAMMDEELAEWLATAIAKHYDIQAVVPNMDSVLWLDWLKQEAKE